VSSGVDGSPGQVEVAVFQYHLDEKNFEAPQVFSSLARQVNRETHGFLVLSRCARRCSSIRASSRARIWSITPCSGLREENLGKSIRQHWT
jgi:hypothetical protein